MVRCCGAKGDQEPLDVISTMASAEEACRLYGKRFRIETFFSDQKSRGVHIHTAHLAAPLRLARFLMAACFASIWVVYLGARGVQDGWGKVLPRGDRCDLSLFQLGLRLLDYVLNEGVTIPVAFSISIETLGKVSGSEFVYIDKPLANLNQNETEHKAEHCPLQYYPQSTNHRGIIPKPHWVIPQSRNQIHR